MAVACNCWRWTTATLTALGVVSSGRALLTVQIPRSGRLDEVPAAGRIHRQTRPTRQRSAKRWLVLGVRDAQG